MGFYLEFLGAIIILAAAMFAVLARDNISGGIVGLSITYALQVINLSLHVITPALCSTYERSSYVLLLIFFHVYEPNHRDMPTQTGYMDICCIDVSFIGTSYFWGNSPRFFQEGTESLQWGLRVFSPMPDSEMGCLLYTS